MKKTIFTTLLLFATALTAFGLDLTLLDKRSGQYYSENWLIGKSYFILLKLDGISYLEADRMFDCYKSI